MLRHNHIQVSIMTDDLRLVEIHEMLSMCWKGIRSRYPQGLIEATISSIALTMGFIFPATFYLLLDQCFPEFAKRYKIQDWDKQPNGEMTLRIVLHSLFNYISTMLGIFLFHWSFGWRTSVYRMDEKLPSICTVGLECFYAVVIREIIFYYVHRLLHHPFFFWIHKKHHEAITPIGFAAIHCHPIEMMIQNSLPIGLPLAVFRGHFWSQMIFATYAVWDSTAAHSGYKFGRFPSPKVHDKHHETPLLHGVWGFMDWLHGTDRSQILETIKAKNR